MIKVLAITIEVKDSVIFNLY